MSFSVVDGWGKDALSAYFQDAYHNCIASFVNYRNLPIMKAMKEVDDSFRCLVGITFKRAREIFLPNFIARSHAAYFEWSSAFNGWTGARGLSVYSVMPGKRSLRPFHPR